MSGELSTVMLACCDHLGALLDVLAAGLPQPDAAVQARGDALLATLTAQFLGGSLPAEDERHIETSGGGVVTTDAWHLSVRFGPGVLKNGVDPLSLLHYLTSLGEITHLTTLADTLPAADAMDPECCYLGFEIGFQTRASKAQIEQVFDFVRDECTLHILPPHSKIDEYMQLIKESPEDPMRLGEILVYSGALTQAELDTGLAAQSRAAVESDTLPPRPIGAILVEQKVVHSELVEAAASRQTVISEKKTREARMIRVHADKLDQLIDLVGEMVIAGASTYLLAQRSGRSELIESTAVLRRLVENIRDSALQLRMVPIGETFNRFQRVVRDNARELGKTIDLVITGAETELDKSVVEKLGDPLMHLVRNAIDHGIEAKAARLEAGKPEKGTVRLNAFHESGSIVIQVGDDGGGLDKNRILAKAMEKGLVAEGTELAEEDIFKLIFEPGFSTAEQVTNISGRGVGMDVVRRNIESLRGSVHIDSAPGQGTTIAIRLPLTLAIIDGFLTGVGDAAFVVPLDLVEECIELTGDATSRDYLNLRGEVLPFLRLREQFGVPGQSRRRQSVVVVRYAGKRAGLVVDELMGEFQTVIKPLGPVFAQLRGIAGSTILGSGDVALILDVPNLIARTTSTAVERPALAS